MGTGVPIGEVGKIRADSSYPARVVTFGVKGQADLSGILRGGIRIEIEVKAPGKKIKKGSDQDRWRKMINRFGGVHIEADCVNDVRQVINRLFSCGACGSGRSLEVNGECPACIER